MKFGIFDHLERSPDRTLSTQFDERIAFVQAAEEAGAYCLHVAEHHSSPLNMVPAPGVYLGAVARATKNIRLGPLVYLLTLYTPLKLAEEVCMLDHLSNGRFELGVGRGVSPYELNFHNVDAKESREIFFDAYECLRAALSDDEFSYESKYFKYEDVPMPLRPLQAPYPPVWYGSSNETGSTWAGERGLHFASNGPVEKAKENVAFYKAAFAKHGKAAHPKEDFDGGVAIGTLRHIVVAETDEAAVKIAKPAMEFHASSLNWIRKRVGDTDFTARNNIHRDEDLESWRQKGMAIVGSPDTVAKALEAQAREIGINYLIAYLFFGTMTLRDALSSLELFQNEVMPRLADI